MRTLTAYKHFENKNESLVEFMENAFNRNPMFIDEISLLKLGQMESSDLDSDFTSKAWENTSKGKTS